MSDTKWILFAKRSSRDNCIGKGRILDCRLNKRGVEFVEGFLLEIDMTLDGVRFAGTLAPVCKQDEEE
tara:strand:+ start:9873 stop:10076 length:204 start_codon:yes stop_codon:yes gene_type:complete